MIAAALAACGQKTDTAAPTLADATAPKAMEAIKEDVARASLPKANKATPIEDYIEFSSGHQIMFAYLALAAMPVDYKEIASTYSQDFARASDEFRKNDLLIALKPKIDDEVSKAGKRRYAKMTIDNPIEKYDFDKKGFPVENSLWQSGSYRYFNDNSAYRLGFSNGDAFRYLNVASEEGARTIEGLRSKYEPLQMVVYFYTQEADVSKKSIKAEIVKIALLGKNGNVLASQ
jgi:hypothetical protein